MGLKIGDDTKFELRIRDLIVILVTVGSAMGMYFSLKEEIEEAKELPLAPVTKGYIDSQHALLKSEMSDVKEELSEIKDIVKTLDSRIYDIHQTTIRQQPSYTAYENY